MMKQAVLFVNAIAHRQSIRDAAVLAAVSAVVSTIFFCGFGLGDDAAYHALAVRINASGYPRIEGTDVFAGRPLILLPLAAGYAVLGRGEWVFVLPTILASILCVVSMYLAARWLGGRPAGFIAALLLLSSPLHLAHAATVTNDIQGAALLALGAVCFIGAQRLNGGRLTLAIGGGVIAGLSAGVKSSFVLFWICFVLLALATSRSAPRLKLTGAFVLGGVASGAALALFFLLTSGDPLAGPRAEIAFNRTHMLSWLGHTPLAERLLFYPRLMLGLLPTGPPGGQWRPGGGFFIVCSLAFLHACWRRHHAAVAAGALAAGWFLLLEFWPLQVSPYAPIHRLPRFLYPVMLPAGVCAGLVLATQLPLRSRRVPMIAALTLMASVHLWYGSRAVLVHRDSMSDVKFAADVILAADGPVVIDEELMTYINYRASPSPVRNLLRLSPGVVAPPGALVVAGGSRRPELEPEYTKRLMPSPLPREWHPLFRLPGKVSGWRPVPGMIYLASTRRSRTAELRDACPTDTEWLLADVLDLGDPASEAEHDYRISGQTWTGGRTFRRGLVDIWDDGRAFVGEQAFVLRGLLPASDACLVKRIDPLLYPQVSRWVVNERVLPDVVSGGPSNGDWGHSTVVIPSESVGASSVTLREQLVRSPHDINAFRIEVYRRGASRDGR